MKFNTTNFCSISVLVAVFGMATGAFASQAPNPRSGGTVVSAPRSDVTESRRASSNVVASSSGATVSRAATRRATSSTVARGTISAPAVVNATVSRSGRTIRKAPSVSISPVRGAASVSRAASSNVVRSAVSNTAGASARSATTGASRAGMARATAVFDDVSKMGTGYSTCRDAYSTCMDQLCAKANDTYRRCFCSARFTEFRDTEAALDEAKTLLMQFEDNSLNAVDKTAAEVNAMYSATVGEAAIKKDTSAAQKTLNEIGELLSGKKKATGNTSASTSLGVLSLDFTADVDDIWSGDGSGSVFGGLGGNVDLSQLEGAELYNQANTQCLKIVADSCENQAVLNMARSSYSVLISQDCNAYEKKVESQREAVKQTVRTAEKYLRDARLEEYRTHNSADVNECVAKVKNAITTDTACGENYKKCLDYTGAYVNPSTGEAVYSQRLFELENLISLGGANAGTDLLGQNPQFNSFLDEKRMFAKTALDTCRDMADIVWTEFKRSALIEIAQAQDALIEKTKSSCVATMKECYDTQSDGLKSFDDTTAQVAGALSVYAAKAMCQDKVTACASLYGDTDGCSFDGNGKLVTANDNSGKRCGLTALLSFVDTVDTVRVAEGCATAIDSYVKDLCTPTAGTMGFPWNCRTKTIGNATGVSFKAGADASVADNIRNFAVSNCSDPTAGTADYNSLPLQTKTQVEKAINNIREQLEYQLMETCESLDGYWLDGDEENDLNGNPVKQLVAFYTSVYGNSSSGDKVLGQCVENTTMLRCLAYNTGETTAFASYDRAKDECTFTDAWYETQCNLLGSGYYENGVCYVAP